MNESAAVYVELTDSRSAEVESVRDEVAKLQLAFELLAKALSHEGVFDSRFLAGTGNLFDRIEALERRFDHKNNIPDGGSPTIKSFGELDRV